MKRVFSNFSVEADFKIPVTDDNFNYDIIVRDHKDLTAGIIKKGELTRNIANDFAIGDENTVKNAIIRVIHNRELWIQELRNMLYVHSI